MIKIIKASTLDGLRSRASRCATLSELLDENADFLRAAVAESACARQAQAKAEAARAAAETKYAILHEDTMTGIARLGIAVSDPRTGHAVQAEIALNILRRHIAEAKASGDPNIIGSVRILDLVLGEDSTPASPNDTTPEIEEES